ncbi:MAG: amino acid permease [Mariniphaga sp.]|nr:amino acid permease [Mariniphaga sp.]
MPGEQLQRKLGIFSLSNIVVANMIGAGIFVTSGLLMETLNNPVLLIILWIIAGVIALCGAIAYGELGATIPKAGGEYIFLSELFHPLLGFLSGWTSFIVGFSAPIAASAIGFSEYFTRAFPGLLSFANDSGILSADNFKKVLSITVIAVFTLIHTRGIEASAKVQNWLTVLKVVLVAGLIFIGFTFGKGSFDHFQTTTNFSFNLGGWKTIGLSLMWIMFAYSGWNASTYIGSEIKNPVKNIPKSLLLGTGIVILLYIGLNIFFVYAIPPNVMKGVISVGGLAVNYAFGKDLEVLFSMLISFALFSSLSAYLILGPRVFFSMAHDGFFFKSVAKINPVTKVPSLAILLQATISIIMVLSGTFDQILTYLGFSLGIFPILAVIGVIKLRLTKKSKIKLPGYPITHIIFILSGFFILILAYFERPIESSIAIGTVLIGIPFFYILKKNKKKKAT